MTKKLYLREIYQQHNTVSCFSASRKLINSDLEDHVFPSILPFQLKA